MFGYIRPYKPRMEISDYELYKASYCGLCKELKKLDKIGTKNFNDRQKKHLNKLVKRNEWYFKKLIS